MANEKRLIDANAFLEKLSRMIDYCKNDSKVDGLTALFQVGDAIMDCPTVDAVEVVHGRWIMDKLEIGNPYDGNSTMVVDIGNCSCCGYRCEMLPVMNYCPNCGTKMDGDGNGNEM